MLAARVERCDEVFMHSVAWFDTTERSSWFSSGPAPNEFCLCAIVRGSVYNAAGVLVAAVQCLIADQMVC